MGAKRAAGVLTFQTERSPVDVMAIRKHFWDSRKEMGEVRTRVRVILRKWLVRGEKEDRWGGGRTCDLYGSRHPVNRLLMRLHKRHLMQRVR